MYDFKLNQHVNPKDSNVFNYIQNRACHILNQNPTFQENGVTIIPENSRSVEFEIKQALSKQGICSIVHVQKCDYIGVASLGDKKSNAWDITLSLETLENVPINRAGNREHVMTALDVASLASETLCGYTNEYFGEFLPVTVKSGEDDNIVVSTFEFKTASPQSTLTIPNPETFTITNSSHKTVRLELDNGVAVDLAPGQTADSSTVSTNNPCTVEIQNTTKDKWILDEKQFKLFYDVKIVDEASKFGIISEISGQEFPYIYVDNELKRITPYQIHYCYRIKTVEGTLTLCTEGGDSITVDNKDWYYLTENLWIRSESNPEQEVESESESVKDDEFFTVNY